jgi:hypothetical protein
VVERVVETMTMQKIINDLLRESDDIDERISIKSGEYNKMIQCRKRENLCLEIDEMISDRDMLNAAIENLDGLKVVK